MIHIELSWKSKDGIDLWAREWRPDSGPLRGVVNLIHGIGEHTGRYEHVAQFLTDAGYVVAAFDLRGHGRSGGRRAYTPSYNAMMDDIALLLHHSRQTYPGLPLFLYGHSFGGGLVLNFVLRNKPELNGVIATGPLLRTAFQPPRIKVLAGKVMNRLIPTFTMTNGLSPGDLYHNSVDDHLNERDPLVHSFLTARLGILMLECGQWALEHAGEFGPPLLLMHGGEDHITDPSASREFAAKIPDKCRLKIWDGLYHELHNEPEQQAEVFQMIKDWLEEHGNHSASVEPQTNTRQSSTANDDRKETDRKYMIAIDQGTTGTTMLLVDRKGQILHKYYQAFPQSYPQPGWVEHDLDTIYQTVLDGLQEILTLPFTGAQSIAAIGITNQRETIGVWERATGQPVHPAIVWQCRRTTGRCSELMAQGYEAIIQAKTGLRIDPYFSATKLEWLLQKVDGIERRAAAGEIICGTIDTWLIWKLTGGRSHVTDPSNASRTMLYNIHQLNWDQDLLNLFHIPAVILPQVIDSAGDFGMTDPSITGEPIPICGVLGDQQAALFGQGCFTPGEMKNTYGTGCFLLMNTGEKPCPPQDGLLSTIAWKIGDRVTYALEGSVFIGGAAIQWLRDEMGLIETAAESESRALRVENTNGAYFVPAFTGLGAPYWDPYARGAIVGLTRGVNRDHIVRAALESIAFQVREVIDCMTAAAGSKPAYLRVDGGAAANNFLLQFQSDISELELHRNVSLELTGLGAAFIAGLSAGFWPNIESLAHLVQVDRVFRPEITETIRNEHWSGWLRAVEHAKGWVVEE
jgi:glycerol kinase